MKILITEKTNNDVKITNENEQYVLEGIFRSFKDYSKHNYGRIYPDIEIKEKDASK